MSKWTKDELVAILTEEYQTFSLQDDYAPMEIEHYEAIFKEAADMITSMHEVILGYEAYIAGTRPKPDRHNSYS